MELLTIFHVKLQSEDQRNGNNFCYFQNPCCLKLESQTIFFFFQLVEALAFTCGVDITSVTSDLSHLKIKSCVIPLPVRKLTSDVREELPPKKIVKPEHV